MYSLQARVAQGFVPACIRECLRWQGIEPDRDQRRAVHMVGMTSTPHVHTYARNGAKRQVGPLCSQARDRHRLTTFAQFCSTMRDGAKCADAKNAAYRAMTGKDWGSAEDGDCL